MAGAPRHFCRKSFQEMTFYPMVLIEKMPEIWYNLNKRT